MFVSCRAEHGLLLKTWPSGVMVALDNYQQQMSNDSNDSGITVCRRVVVPNEQRELKNLPRFGNAFPTQHTFDFSFRSWW